MLNCREFLNADEIARGISPFQPEKVAIAAGRLMLERIAHLISEGVDFAFETTLSSKSFLKYIEMAHLNGYQTNLLFFWLTSVEMAIRRVKLRVQEGGHDIPHQVIIRRYHRGLANFFKKYKNSVDQWMLIDNSNDTFKLVCKSIDGNIEIYNNDLWSKILDKYGR